MTDKIIEVQNLTFEYTSDEAIHRAIDEFDMEISKGEFDAIIGHNGSGKSTLSKNLNAILVPTKGDVLIGGMNTRDRSEEHTSELQSRQYLGCRLLLEKKTSSDV